MKSMKGLKKLNGSASASQMPKSLEISEISHRCEVLGVHMGAIAKSSLILRSARSALVCETTRLIGRHDTKHRAEVHRRGIIKHRSRNALV
jgi:hypothetical protein